MVLNSDTHGGCLIQVNYTGRRFDVAAREDLNFGIFSACERLQLFGGQLEILSAPGQGTQITITALQPTITG